MAGRLALRYDPLPPLVSSANATIRFLARRDLAGEDVGPGESLWALPDAQRILQKQKGDGGWSYPGGGKEQNRAVEDYDQIETFRMVGFLVEKYGFNCAHPAMQRAGEYLLARQTVGGDLRGIYGNQYSPNYSAAIMELLIKAGYADDSRVERGLNWLLAMRQNDGGWAIPIRTTRAPLSIEVLGGPTVQPDRSKPFSHLATGVVLRAFAAHPRFRSCPQAHEAATLLASRFFQRDAYSDRGAPGFWTKFTFPFWFTDLLSALDAVSLLGVTADDPHVGAALDWLASQQQESGLWQLYALKSGSDRDLASWLSLAICRVLRRLGAV